MDTIAKSVAKPYWLQFAENQGVVVSYQDGMLGFDGSGAIPAPALQSRLIECRGDIVAYLEHQDEIRKQMWREAHRQYEWASPEIKQQAAGLADELRRGTIVDLAAYRERKNHQLMAIANDREGLDMWDAPEVDLTTITEVGALSILDQESGQVEVN